MATAAPEDPAEVVRTASYTKLLALAAVLGVPVSICAYVFLLVTSWIQTWLYRTIPHMLPSAVAGWWPIIPLTMAGGLVGFIVTSSPGHAGEVPVEGFKPSGGPPNTAYLPAIAAAAVISIGFGAVIGPEAPLIAIGGGLALVFLGRRSDRLKDQARSLVAASGSFAAISTLLGNPLGGAFLLMEATGLGGVLMEVALLPGLLASGIGYLIFVGIDHLTGLGLFSLAIPSPPPYTSPTIVQLVAAVVIGLAAACLIHLLRGTSYRLYPAVLTRPVLMPALAGLTIALLAISFHALTHQSISYVLFSGQNQLGLLVRSAAGLSLTALVLMLIAKGCAFCLSIINFRGGPTFPAMFLGAAFGVLVAHLTGIAMIACLAMALAATTSAMLRLPMTSILLATLLLGSDGVRLLPLTIIAAVTSFVVTVRLRPTMPTLAKAPTRT